MSEIMEHANTLNIVACVREDRIWVERTIATDKYFSICRNLGGDAEDLEDINVLSIADLYAL